MELTSLAGWADRLADRIERLAALDPVAQRIADRIEPMLRPAWSRTLTAGSVAGHPAHPLLVTVPIGSFVAAGALDVAGDRRAARRLIGLGLLTAVPSAVTGLADWSYTAGAERRLGLAHAMANSLALTAYSASWLARRAGRHGAGAGLALGGAAVLGVGGWLGGHLVYARGVGVDTTAFSVAADDWQDTIAEAELLDDEPALVHVRGVPVLLARTGGELVALDDRCSHRGAPLHKGELADGCIQCPWHGSRFRLIDGSVRTGPAVRPQRTWQVRTRYGMVQLRVKDEPGTLRTNPVT